MNDLLTPYCELYKGKDDILYYNIVDKNAGIEAYVFSEYNAFFDNDQEQIVGKCYYVHIPTLESSFYSNFKNKIISGEKFLNMGYKKIDKHFIINSDISIKAFATQNHISEEIAFDNIFASNYSCFNKETIVGVSVPRLALKKLYKKNDKVKKVINGIVRDFDICIDELGITGSLALGCSSSSDYDIVFYSNIEKLNQIKSKIDLYISRNGAVEEYGLKWPCRYYDNDSNLICCFFNCTDYSYSSLKNAKIVDSKYQFDFTIKDDQYSILKTPILKVDDDVISSIIIFNSAFKGTIKNGNRVRGVGKVIKYNSDGKDVYSILCLNPYDEIYNYKSFFGI